MSLSKIFTEDKSFILAQVLPDKKDRSPNWEGRPLITSVDSRKKDPDEEAAAAQAETAEQPKESPRESTVQSLETIKEEAFNRGIQAGLEQAEAQLNETVQALAGALEDIDRVRGDILKESSQDMVELVMAIAEQVIQNEIAVKEDVILATLSQALHAAIESDEFHVKINPDDFAVVSEKKPSFLASINGLKNITFEPDPQIVRGGCLVESDLGQVDATLATRLNEIREHLFNSLGKG